MSQAKKQHTIGQEFIDDCLTYLREGRRLKRKLPTWVGQIYIDRQLPYICVYRQSEEREDWGTEQLLLGEASSLIAPADRAEEKNVRHLVESICEELIRYYGNFLVVEIWSGEDETEFELSADGEESQHTEHRPAFKIYAEKSDTECAYVRTLAKQLSLLKLDTGETSVKMVTSSAIAPPGMKPLVSREKSDTFEVHVVGVEVAPIYRDMRLDARFPALLAALQRQFTKVLEKVFFDFLKEETRMCPPSYLALGRRSMVHEVMRVDRELAEVAESIDFLLLVTPTNSSEAFAEFKHGLFQRDPHFIYNPSPFDPVQLKRKLYRAPVERIEDPTLAQLFREQQLDIDYRISMIAERGTKRFLYASLQLYDAPDRELMELADRILKTVPEKSKGESVGKQLSANQFARRAQKELDFYKSRCPDLPASVQIRDDVPGVLVSHGTLIIGKERRIFEGRAEALLGHEVGTHILTNYNGKAQPFRQLSAGLPGYDELQEPLAVLAEYLVGGLSKRRLRTLAARVIAVGMLSGGATFVDVFRKLTKDYDLHKDIAFGITMRVFRSGGFTKDVVYLRGLINLLEHIRHGLDLKMLYVGKFGMDYLPIVRELLWRKILVPAKLLPHFFESEDAMKRLERLQQGATVLDLV